MSENSRYWSPVIFEKVTLTAYYCCMIFSDLQITLLLTYVYHIFLNIYTIWTKMFGHFAQ